MSVTYVTSLPSSRVRLEKASIWSFQFCYSKQVLPPTKSQKVESSSNTEEGNRFWGISPKAGGTKGANVYYNRTGQNKTLRNLNDYKIIVHFQLPFSNRICIFFLRTFLNWCLDSPSAELKDSDCSIWLFLQLSSLWYSLWSYSLLICIIGIIPSCSTNQN